MGAYSTLATLAALVILLPLLIYMFSFIIDIMVTVTELMQEAKHITNLAKSRNITINETTKLLCKMYKKVKRISDYLPVEGFDNEGFEYFEEHCNATQSNTTQGG